MSSYQPKNHNNIPAGTLFLFLIPIHSPQFHQFFNQSYTNRQNFKYTALNLVQSPITSSTSTQQQNLRVQQNLIKVQVQNQQLIQPENVLKLEAQIQSQKKQENIIQNQSNEFQKKKQNSKKYGHKNTESNIINQVFSFISDKKKSSCYIQRFLRSKQQINMFYKYMDILKKSNKKYINRNTLIEISLLDKQNSKYKVLMKNQSKPQVLSLENFKIIVRKLITFYLNQKCAKSVLTSIKVNKQFRKYNLQRRRQILACYLKGLKQKSYSNNNQIQQEMDNIDDQKTQIKTQACDKNGKLRNNIEQQLLNMRY